MEVPGKSIRGPFSDKLDRWLKDNKAEQDGPISARELARWLTKHGAETSGTSVQNWLNGPGLPSALPIAQLVLAMGAPWPYLVDPTTTWPMSDHRRRALSRIALLSDGELDELLEHLESHGSGDL